MATLKIFTDAGDLHGAGLRNLIPAILRYSTVAGREWDSRASREAEVWYQLDYAF